MGGFNPAIVWVLTAINRTRALARAADLPIMRRRRG